MKKFIENKTVLLLVAITVIAAVIIGVFAALSSRDKASLTENVYETAAMPGQTAASGIGGWLSNIFSYFGSVKELRAENEALKLENTELDKQLRDARGMEEENAQLREMLDLKKTENKMDLKAVKIIAKDPSNWYSCFKINKGSKDGIAKEQPVITEKDELVGKVVRVGSDWAEIMTILDPECGVGCIIERSKNTGVLEGDFSLRYTGKCRLGYLSRDTDIEKGDYVETSGMGGVYPKGLLVGKVVDIKEDNTNMSKYAMVEPSADIGSLMQVFVITNNVEVVASKPDLGSGLSDGDKENDSDKNKSGQPENTLKPKESGAPKTSRDNEEQSRTADGTNGENRGMTPLEGSGSE